MTQGFPPGLACHQRRGDRRHGRAAVLITGETGTGKELVTNVVHYNSARA